MATTVKGPTRWSGLKDEQNNREFKIKHLIKCSDSDDGPFTAMNTPGLPMVGSVWVFGNDADLWAFCKPDMTCEPLVDKEKNRYFEIEQTFTTKPFPKCYDVENEHPLLEPFKISGGFTKTTEEGTHDRFGNPITYSSHEPIRGPQNEWDVSRGTIRIEQNCALLEYELLQQMINCVNNAPMWGLPRRSIKLSDVPWSRNFYGVCDMYFKRTLEFEISIKWKPIDEVDPEDVLIGLYSIMDQNGNFIVNPNGLVPVGGWDRDILDEGTKALNGEFDNTTGEWRLKNINGVPPDPNIPSHFCRIIDRNGTPMKLLLDGHGKPVEVAKPLVVTCPACQNSPDDRTFDCNQCPDGAPPKWVISGFIGDSSIYNIELTHVTGCQWYGSVVLQPSLVLINVWLVYEPTNDVFHLYNDAAVPFSYQRSIEFWDCLGVNLLRNNVGEDIVVTPKYNANRDRVKEGAAENYRISGFTGANTKFNLVVTYVVDPVRSFTSKCLWSALAPGKPKAESVADWTLELEYFSAGDEWVLSSGGLTTIYARIAGSDWDCLKPNYSGSISITPLLGTTQGKRHIEKYNEVDFMKLNPPPPLTFYHLQ